MPENTTEVDLTDKAELETFLKESGLDSIIGAMKINASKTKKVTKTRDEINWMKDIIRSFEPVHLHLNSYYVVLIKLLDHLSKKEFSGCLFVNISKNTSMLFLWKGELIGIINDKKNSTDEEAFRYILGNYHDATIDIYQAPEGKEALPLILISIVRKDLDPKYKDLDTEFTDLHKLISKLEENKFMGYIEMKIPEGTYISCFYNGKEIITIFLDRDNKFSTSTLNKMRNEIGSVDVYQSRARTLVRSMEDLMSKITVLVQNKDEEALTLSKIVHDFNGHITLNAAEEARDNVDFNISMPAGLANRDDCESFKEQIRKTPEFRFIRYFFSQYFLDVAETGNSISMKSIWNNVPRVRVIKFKQKYNDSHVEHAFDIIMEDGSGNVLFAAKNTGKAPRAYEVEVFIKQLEDIKEKSIDWNGLKAGFFVSSGDFEAETISAAKKSASYRAAVNSMLGKMGNRKVAEVLTAPKGFVKTEHGGGFHLNLIHQNSDSFQVIFPSL